MITVYPLSLNFDYVTVGDGPSSLGIAISNYGASSVSVSAISSNPRYTLSQSSFIVDSSSSYTLTVYFLPLTDELETGIIVLTTTDVESPVVQVSVQGTGRTSSIFVDKTSVDFGKTGIYDVKQQTVRVRNTGTVDLIISNIVSSNTVFVVLDTNFRLFQNQERQVRVEYRPEEISNHTGVLTILNNSSQGDVHVNLLGESVSGQMYVNKTSLDFGNVTIQDSKSLNIIVSNINTTDQVELLLRNVSTTNPLFKETIDRFKVAAGTALQFPVTFSPTNTASQTGKLIIESNDVSQPVYEVNLTGKGIVAPNIKLSTTLINFGDVAINRNLTKTFQIINSGVSVLNVLNVVTNNTKFVVSPSTQTIGPNASSNFQVVFSPTEATNYLAKISITSNDPDEPVVYINLQGAGVSSSIEVSPKTLEFSNVSVGTSKLGYFSILNKSSVELVVSDIQVNNQYFSVLETFPLQIQTSKNVSIQFSPELVGRQDTAILISSNDINHPEVQIPAFGVGVVPDISIQPTSLNFFNVSIGQSSSLSVNILNLGKGKLIVSNIESTNTAFEVNKTNFEIEPNQTQSLLVTFSPINTGQKTGEINLTNNDPDSPDIVLPVQGFGAYPIASVTPTSINFGATVVNSTKEQVINISNTGRANLSVSLGATLPQYSVIPSNLTVEPNLMQTVKVIFSPSSVQSYSGEVNLSTNDPDNPSISVVVAGSGIVAPKISVNPRTLNFGEVSMNGTKQLPITVSNTGTQLLTFSNSVENPIRPGRPPTFTANPTSGAVSINGQTTITVVFRPADPEQLNGKLKITSNDLSESLVEVTLQGRGKPAVLEWDLILAEKWVPREIRTIAKSISTVVPPLITALDFTKQVLDIIKVFIINIDDPMKILLTQIKKLINDFIDDLSATGLYMLYVLPGRPGITPYSHPQYYRNLPAENYNIFDPNNPSWFDSVKGGYSSFISKVVDSFDDPGDGNRPQFSSDGMVGGYVMMFNSGTIGPDDLSNFLKAVQKICKIFKSPFKAAFEPPSNVSTFAGNKTIKVTFTPSVSVLPKEYFIFRSETQGGDIVNDKGGLEFKDENGKVIRTWKLIGITNVASQLAKIMGVNEQQAKTWLGEVGYAAKELSKTILSNDPFRFVFEDTAVENDKTYYYVVAAGYTTSGNDTLSKYKDIIDLDRSSDLIYLNNSTDGNSKGLYTSDFEKKIDVLSVEKNPMSILKSKILSIGALSSEVSAKPISYTLETNGGLARCRNFRCGFEIDETEFFDLTEQYFDITNPAGALEFITLARTPVAGSVRIKVTRKDKDFFASQNTYRVEDNKVYIRAFYYFQPNDALTINYKYRKDLQTKQVTDSAILGSDSTFLTTNKPIDSQSVQVSAVMISNVGPTQTVSISSSDVIVLNDKDGRIKVKRPPGTKIICNYKYFSDFSESDFFKCVKPEYSRYFFDISKCDAGSTLCPGYDNANCYFNMGSGCTNTNISQRKVHSNFGFIPEDIAFSEFWDPVACQNGMMKQRCDGYSKTFPRYAQKTWPDWSSIRLSALGMFPKIEEIMKVMENLLDSLLAGTEKMDTATTNFIDLLQKKIDSLRRFIELIDSFLQVIVEDFALPEIYFLNIPYARGGNEYLKTSIRNSTKGPVDDSSAYTAGIVLVYGTPGLGNALNFFFGD